MQTNKDQGKYEVEEAMEMLGKGYETRIRDKSNDRKYFTIVPRIIQAYSRNAFDLALWETIKGIAGEDGECYLSTPDLAVLAGMSSGQVSNSRRYWIKIGFLAGEVRRDPGYPQPVWHLNVPDLWKKNVEWCEKHLKIEERLLFKLSNKSLHRMKPSPGERGTTPGERGTTPGETKKNLNKVEKHTQRAQEKSDTFLGFEKMKQETEDRIQLVSYSHRCKFEFNETVLMFADQCVKRFGAPFKKDVSGWVLELGSWADAGCIRADWDAALKIVEKYTTPVMSVQGMTKAVKFAAQQRRTNPAPLDSRKPMPNFKDGKLVPN